MPASTAGADPTPAVLTAPHAARVERLQRALQLLEEEVLWPFYEPVQRVGVVNKRAMSAADVVEVMWQESLSK